MWNSFTVEQMKNKSLEVGGPPPPQHPSLQATDILQIHKYKDSCSNPQDPVERSRVHSTTESPRYRLFIIYLCAWGGKREVKVISTQN